MTLLTSVIDYLTRRVYEKVLQTPELPFMMKRIKRWRTGRKVNRMLNEITKNKKEDVEAEEQPHEN